VPLVSPDKKTAKKLQRLCQDVAGASAVAAAGSNVAAGLGPEHVSSVQALGTFLAVAAGALAVKAGQVADDPPRSDFKTSTHVTLREINVAPVMRRAYGTQFAERGQPMGTLLEERLRDVGLYGFNASAYLDALVRAFERASGALEAEADEFLTARAQEAREFAGDAAGFLKSFAVRAESVPAGLDDEIELREAVAKPDVLQKLRTGPGALIHYLPDKAMAILFEAGIRIEEVRDLRVPWPRGDDPWGEAAESIKEAGSTAREFADSLGVWKPLIP
jgi:hypothetical protein